MPKYVRGVLFEHAELCTSLTFDGQFGAIVVLSHPSFIMNGGLAT